MILFQSPRITYSKRWEKNRSWENMITEKVESSFFHYLFFEIVFERQQGMSQDGDALPLMAKGVLTHILIGAFLPESSQCAHRYDDGRVGESVAVHHLHFPNQRTPLGHHLSEC